MTVKARAQRLGSFKSKIWTSTTKEAMAMIEREMILAIRDAKRKRRA